MPSIDRLLLALILSTLMQATLAGTDHSMTTPAIKQAIDGFSDQVMQNQSGIINDKKYVAIINYEDDSILVLMINRNGGYEPIAKANLGYLPYPSVRIEGNSIVVQAVNYYRGVLNDIEFRFQMKNGKFRLSEIKDFVDNTSEHQGSIIRTIVQLTVADFNKYKVKHWKRRFTVYKDHKDYKPGSQALSDAMNAYRRDSKLPFPASVSFDLPKQSFDLDGFQFEKSLESLSNAVARRVR